MHSTSASEWERETSLVILRCHQLIHGPRVVLWYGSVNVPPLISLLLEWNTTLTHWVKTNCERQKRTKRNQWTCDRLNGRVMRAHRFRLSPFLLARYFSSPLDPCDSLSLKVPAITKQHDGHSDFFFFFYFFASFLLPLHVSRLLRVFSRVNETHCKYIHASLDRTKSSEEESSGDFMKIITDDSVSSRRHRRSE